METEAIKIRKIGSANHGNRTLQAIRIPQTSSKAHSVNIASRFYKLLQDLKTNAPGYDKAINPPKAIAIANPPESSRPNTKPLFHPLAKERIPFNSICPLRSHAFLNLLADYPSPEFPVLLADIITYGAKLGYEGPFNLKVKQNNHPSVVRSHNQVISDELQKELALGRLQKLDTLPQSYYCSPLGLVPKTENGNQTGWRRIFDLSSPTGNSVNDYINPAFGTLQYETFDDAINAIAASGKGSVMMKRDLKAAFRMIPVCTEDQWLLIFEWGENYYQELFLPFGLRTAPFIFNLFGEAFQWILQRKYSWVLRRYLDDFLVVLPPGHDTSRASIQFTETCQELGFTEADEKRQNGTCVTYLGLILDTVRMEARLPLDKKLRALNEITAVLARGSATLKELEKLLGLLEFCGNVFPLGRPFLRHVWNMFRGVKFYYGTPRKTCRQRLTAAACHDLQWWQKFLPIWSGVSAIQMSRQLIHVSTDASGKKGIGGAWFEDMRLFSTRLPRRHRPKHINWKEMTAIVYAFAEWSENWQHKKVLIFCDNQAVVSGVNKRTIRGTAIRPLQTLFLLAARRNIDVAAVWIPSQANTLADALSRFDKKRIADLVGEQLANSLPHRQTSLITSKISLLLQPFTCSTV
jgi:RNase H./Reverse transcriptase (RNA-dependent DNA polymerase).